ncbi:hypothetical protein UREG_06634 [Uncinocarpus reesii 1704]|uniref:FCP1 homology domain-containing protein n=1 Tax=Uncinocarpus reesii (strain UAMH 1704) TaxID=336963 RepID=C4JVP2_UNCRE|nr:uncharacterized protein UREG_06634 [Uncinocarpus reesii 1704]EEP81769.1 hypothetical protein UREG_06634 [Uncinocarpus reesii 1704]
MADSKDPLPFDEKATLKANPEPRSSRLDPELKVAAGEPTERDADKLAPKLSASPNTPYTSPQSTTPPQDEPAQSAPADEPERTVVREMPPPNEEQLPSPKSPRGEEKSEFESCSTSPTHGPEDETATAAPIQAVERQPDFPPPPPPPADRTTHAPDTQAPPVPPVPLEKAQFLLPPIEPHLKDRKCLVLDLDETLVHSSFKVGYINHILDKADFTIPVEIEGQYHNIYVIKRPGVDQFMKRVGELYEVVVFTASVSKYGDPLLDQLDIHRVVHHRLFRDSCYNHQGNYVKDLSQVGRNLKDTIIIDNSPTSYIFHPQHAIPISSWFSDAHDNELLDLIPVLEDLAGCQVHDVSLVLDVAL